MADTFGALGTAACMAQVLSSPTRLRLLKLVETSELCVCDLSVLLGVSQPAVSQHLAKLRQAGLVTERRIGQMSLYSAHDVAEVLRTSVMRVFERPAAELPEMAEALRRMSEARERRELVIDLSPTKTLRANMDEEDVE
jgi:ArsR family transcriptional regulator